MSCKKKSNKFPPGNSKCAKYQPWIDNFLPQKKWAEKIEVQNAQSISRELTISIDRHRENQHFDGYCHKMRKVSAGKWKCAKYLFWKGFVIFLTLRDSGEGLNVKIDLEVVREICVELPQLSYDTLTLTIAPPVFSLEPKNYPKNGHFS